LTDVSGYGNDGTIDGASWVTGMTSTSYDNTPKTIGGGNALSFDGVDDVVKFGSINELNLSAYTLMVWAKSDEFATYQGIISNGDGTNQAIYAYNLYINETTYGVDGQYQQLVFNAGGVSEGTDLSYNMPMYEWKHISITVDNSEKTAKMYVDGNLHKTKNYTTASNNYGDLQFGGWHSNKLYYLNGGLDEISIWNEALTADEITALYNSGTALDARANSGNYASTANLKGYWKMEDGSGTTLTDVSGYGNDGTIDGATWTNGVTSTSYDNTPKSIDSEAPDTPTGLKATPTSDGGVKLIWSANSESDLASYNIYGGTAASPTTLLSTVSSGTETYTQTSLSRGETYYYRISAVDNSGNESDKTSDAASGLVSHVTLDHSVSEYVGRVGLTGTGEWHAMSRWVTSDYTSQGIGSNNNLYLKKITFYAADDVDSTTYKLLAWKGSLGSSPVMTESVSPAAVNALNAITLSSPVELDASNPIMFGMSYNQLYDGQYPAGRDKGPAVQNGDLISTNAGGSWVSMNSEYGLNYNWLLSGQLIDNDDVFVEALTVDFTSASDVESSTLTSGQSYYLRVTGTASYCCSGGTNGVDAAYYFRGEQGQLIDNPSPWTPTDNGWSWNGQTGAIRRPSPDSYSPHHIYYYYFTGDGSTELFQFRDNGYGDNSGSLKIEIWENK